MSLRCCDVVTTFLWRCVFTGSWRNSETLLMKTKSQHMSERTTISTICLLRPAKTQISLHIRAVWSESYLSACAFYSLRATLRRMNENPCYIGWMYRLIRVLAGHTGFIVGFVVRWLDYYELEDTFLNTPFTRALQKVLSLGSDYFSATFYQTYFYYKPSKYSSFTETHFCNLLPSRVKQINSLLLESVGDTDK